MSSLCAVIAAFLGLRVSAHSVPSVLPAHLAQAVILESNVNFLGTLPLTLSQKFPSCIHHSLYLYLAFAII